MNPFGGNYESTSHGRRSHPAVIRSGFGVTRSVADCYWGEGGSEKRRTGGGGELELEQEG